MTFIRPRHLGMSLSCPSRAIEGPPPMTSAVCPSQSRENRIHVQAVDLLEGRPQRLPVLRIALECQGGAPDHLGVEVDALVQKMCKSFQLSCVPKPVDDGQLWQWTATAVVR